MEFCGKSILADIHRGCFELAKVCKGVETLRAIEQLQQDLYELQKIFEEKEQCPNMTNNT
ncbi:hypothetical protein LCGC14_2163470 [marine sediment metagenome]|uniref:Uncharacterized protein n=1 Tax=marine sediment metagenome TaxID=412755 RepID=A0A0F9G4S2_9ZZZZ